MRADLCLPVGDSSSLSLRGGGGPGGGGGGLRFHRGSPGGGPGGGPGGWVL